MFTHATGSDQVEAIRAQLLHAGLELSSAGVPESPLLIIELDHLAASDPATIARAAAVLHECLPLTVGVLRHTATADLSLLLDALTLTLTDTRTPAPTGFHAENPPRHLVPVPDIDAALVQLAAAVARSPQTALTCGHLLRRTGGGASITSALAAEAAAYSMLLGGNEFERWLIERDSAGQRVAAGGKLIVGGDIVPVRGPLPHSVVTTGTDPLVDSEPAAGSAIPVSEMAPEGHMVGVRRAGSHLSIVLNNPARRNALSIRMREELLAALTVAEADADIESVELRGAGPAFCSGGDLREFGAAVDPVAAYLVRLDRAPWRVLDRIADRSTVRVHGACIGAGVEMAAFGGRVCASPDSWFRFPEVAMGLIPGAGGTVSVPRRIGRWRAAWLMLTGTPLSVGEALRWGLVDDVSDSTE
ncbi:enoyl-CoA hydratase/isomerase family protein [Nocardia jejuensis]|uniref:enoyl-CoA hydratase/isomerase family protein n=1 Tax=Nocardia jejuensis TaxID=328049 RepID=UPI00083294B0|nr:enoyl-CoA hydratase/isomerase family protein [Nocardia jejuensis]